MVLNWTEFNVPVANLACREPTPDTSTSRRAPNGVRKELLERAEVMQLRTDKLLRMQKPQSNHRDFASRLFHGVLV